MRAYVIRRLLLVVPTVLLLTILVFLSVRFLPGDVIDYMASTQMAGTVGPLDRAGLERQLGLDVPIHMQYPRWLAGIILRGSFGESLTGRGAVERNILERLPITLELGALAIPRIRYR